MNRQYNIIILLIVFCNLILASTRIVYTRPGLMMRVPTSSVQNAPYIFRTGFGVELHNFDPINTAKGVYFDMEFGKGFKFCRSFQVSSYLLNIHIFMHLWVSYLTKYYREGTLKP